MSIQIAPCDMHVGMIVDNCELIEDYGDVWLCRLLCCSNNCLSFVRTWRWSRGKSRKCQSCINEARRIPPTQLTINTVSSAKRKLLKQNPMDLTRLYVECLMCGDRKWVAKSCFNIPCRCSRRKEILESFGELLVLRQDPIFQGRVICQCSCGREESISRREFRKGKRLQCQTCVKIKYSPDQSLKRVYWRVMKIIVRARWQNIYVHTPWLIHPEEFVLYLITLEYWDNPILEVDRIDNNRGYEPGNLRWETRVNQMRNTQRAIDRRERTLAHYKQVIHT